MIINDGYTLLLTIGEHQARFRPLLHWERVHFTEKSKRVGDIKSTVFACMDRIEYSTFDAEWLEGVSESNEKLFYRIVQGLMGVGRAKDEVVDAKNLLEGVKLRLTHPYIKSGVCGFCKEHWYDPTRGKLTAPVESKREGPVPCEVEGMSCPVGHYLRPKALSPKNEKAYRFHLECQATGIFPEDSIVRQNARIIEEATRCVNFARSSKR